MSALLVTAAVLAACALYLLVGWRIAMSRRPRMWAAAREAWVYEDSRRGSVRAQFIFTILFWAVLLPCAALFRHLDQITEAGDPEELARKIADRDRRIAQLERELGIKA